jgi:hypothetical protein
MTTQRATGDNFELGTLVSGMQRLAGDQQDARRLLVTQRSTVPDSCQNEQAAAVLGCPGRGCPRLWIAASADVVRRAGGRASGGMDSRALAAPA